MNKSTPRNYLRLFTCCQVATFTKYREESYDGLVCCRLPPSCGGTLYVVVVVAVVVMTMFVGDEVLLQPFVNDLLWFFLNHMTVTNVGSQLTC